MNTVIQPDIIRAEDQAYSDGLRRAQAETWTRPGAGMAWRPGC